MADVQLLARPEVDYDRKDIDANLLADETRLVAGLRERVLLNSEERADILRRAQDLNGLDAGDGFGRLAEDLDLTTTDAVALVAMLAETAGIADQQALYDVVSERLAAENDAGSLAWAMRSGVLDEIGQALKHGGERRGGPLFRATVGRVISIVRSRLVCGPTIDAAISATGSSVSDGGQVTFALAGLRPWRPVDADANVAAMIAAIEAIAGALASRVPSHRAGIFSRPALSIRLRDLDSRFGHGSGSELRAAVARRLKDVTFAGAANGVMVIIESEAEASMDAVLTAFESVFIEPEIASWDGLGLTVSAQSKRAVPILRWLRRMALGRGKRIPVRLTESGSDWHLDLSQAAEQGLAGTPVLSTRQNVALSMMASARLLLSEPMAFYPIFATVDPWQLAAATGMSPGVPRDFEHPWAVGDDRVSRAAALLNVQAKRRVRAPVGAGPTALYDVLQELVKLTPGDVPYLVTTRAADSIADPLEEAETAAWDGASEIVSFAGEASAYFDGLKIATSNVPLGERSAVEPLVAEIAELIERGFEAMPLVAIPAETLQTAEQVERFAPQDCNLWIGTAVRLDARMAAEAVAVGAHAFDDWRRQDPEIRIDAIRNVTATLIQRRTEVLARIVSETGMTLKDAVADYRSAVEALAWIVNRATETLHGQVPADRMGHLARDLGTRGRGLFAVMSSTAGPLTSMMRQAATAIIAGNSVVLIPPPQLPLLAAFVGERFHDAGVPLDTLQVLPVDVDTARSIVARSDLAGVAFEGPRLLAETLKRDLIAAGRIMMPFIADCGGRHAAVVDGSANIDQAVIAIAEAARLNSGQTHRSPKIVLVADSVLERFMPQMIGAIESLAVGDPLRPVTDVGALIDQETADLFCAQKLRLARNGTMLVDSELPSETAAGAFGAPAAFATDDLADALDLVGPGLTIVSVPAASAASGYGEELAGVSARTVSLFAERRKTMDSVVDDGCYAVLNLNSCGGRYVASVASSGIHDETTSGAAFGTSCWLPQFTRTIAVTTRLDRIVSKPM